MISQEVFRGSVQVRPRHGEMSCGDCKVNKHDFRVLKKLTHCPSVGMGPGRGWPISSGR